MAFPMSAWNISAISLRNERHNGLNHKEHKEQRKERKEQLSGNNKEKKMKKALTNSCRPLRPLWLRPSPFSVAFTLVEMLIVMALIAMLSGILAVAIMGVRRWSIQVECQEHLRQIGQTVQQMALSNGGEFPMLVDNSGATGNRNIPWWARVYQQWEGGGAKLDTDPNADGVQLPAQLPASFRTNFHCRFGGALNGASGQDTLNDSISYGLHFDMKRHRDKSDKESLLMYRCVDKSVAAYPDLAIGPTDIADRLPDRILAPQIAVPSEFILLSEANTQDSNPSNWTGGRISMRAVSRDGSDIPPNDAPIPGRHAGKANVLFADLHIEMRPAQPGGSVGNVCADTWLWTLPND